MLTLPEIITRADQPTLGIREKVPMSGISAMVDRNFPALFTWFARHGIEPAGAPFIRYHVIDMEALLDIEVGLPVAAAVGGEGQVVADALPGGRFAALTYWGPYDRLVEANAVLIGWAKLVGLQWDAAEAPDGDHFGCRLEIYNTDPKAEPDQSKWETGILIRIAD